MKTGQLTPAEVSVAVHSVLIPFHMCRCRCDVGVGVGVGVNLLANSDSALDVPVWPCHM